MHVSRRTGFLEGLTAGLFGSAAGTSAILYLMRREELISFAAPRLHELQPWLGWVYANLGSSIPVFAALLLAYFASLFRLRRLLNETRPVTEIIQLDQLTDIWTTLFFGTGVIWTAIGMRSALLFAIGEPATATEAGAFAVLERLVDGGILLALSTTIVGGVGGYLMRVYKSVALGTLLQRRYDEAARADTISMRDSLARIEKHLADPLPQDAASGEP